MNYLYVDNYRGFSDTIIPIESVNFMVGENSTGKSSILGLFELLSGPDLWFANELNIRKVGFATFNDVVSINSKDRSYFSIGMVFDSKKNIQKPSPRVKKRISAQEKNSETTLKAYIFKFVERQGVPSLDSLLYFYDGYQIHVRVSPRKTLRYKIKARDFGHSASDFIDLHIKNWCKQISTEKTGFSILKGMEHMPIYIALAHINYDISKEYGASRDESELESFFPSIAWIAPIRSKPRITYDEFNLEFTPEGDHTPYLIKKTLASRIESAKFEKFLEDMGRKSGLFKKIEIKTYGRGSAAPFELDIILDKHPLSVNSVGYGVSQALPVIVEVFARPKGSWFAIQQPEVHLHPKAQAALGEIVFNLSLLERKKFMIETHSDFTIDRFRIQTRKCKDTPPSAQILFFERCEAGNIVSSIKIDENGDLSSDQPSSYREFFIREQMDTLGI